MTDVVMANAVGDSDAPQSSYADLGTSSNSEEVTYITTGVPKASRKTRVIDEDEPLVDTTAPLTLRSKKTARGKKKLHKKQQKDAAKASLINLPPELLHDVSFLFIVHNGSRLTEPISDIKLFDTE